MDIERIRDDFPYLRKRAEMEVPIYFDNACMTMKPRQVIDAMNDYYYNFPGCGGRSIHKLGTKVTEAYDNAREEIRRFLNAGRKEECIFTKNATEGINILAYSLPLEKGDRVLLTDKEHNSNLVPWHRMEIMRGVRLDCVPSNPDNTFNLENFKEMLSPDVKFVSMVHTSNLDGVSIPAKDIIEIAHDHGAKIMLDGAQSAPHMPVNVRELDVDFYVISVHKMVGPSGMGILYGKYELLEDLNPFIVGGDTVVKTTYSKSEFHHPPEKFEGGLQNYAGAIGTGAAANYLTRIGLKNIRAHENKLNQYITREIIDIPQVKIIGPEDASKRAGIVSFNIEGVDSHDVAIMMDDSSDILIRSGMHCVHPWFYDRDISGSARASFYAYNTLEEARLFVDTLKMVIDTFT